MVFEAKNLAETELVAAEIAKKVKNGGFLALRSPLKTHGFQWDL